MTSSPHYARSNGLAERYVRYIKATLKKSSDMQLALLNIRATPVDAKLPSPTEMLLGRPLATLLPSRSEPGMEKHRDRMQERQTVMKDQHDKTSRKEDLPSLYTGRGSQNSASPEENVVPWKDHLKVQRAKKLRGGNAKWHTHETQSCTSARARGLTGENCSVQRRISTPDAVQ